MDHDPRFPLQLVRAHVCVAAIVCAAWGSPVAAAGSAGFRIAPPDPWVVPLIPGPIEAGASDRAEGGLHVEWLEMQTRIGFGPTQDYTRSALRIVNQEGLPSASQIAVEFDPSYQQLRFHHVRILRGGEEIDALRTGQVRFLDRERELESQVLHGTVTAVLILDDLRVGDVVDFARTIIGDNPALAPHPSTTVVRAPTHATTRFEQRVVWPSSLALEIRPHRTEAPVPRPRGDTMEVRWSERDLAPRDFVPYLPSGFDDRPFVQFTSFRGWQEVARWGAAMYARPQGIEPAVRAVADTIARRTHDPEARAIAALHVVQEDVRYLSEQLGEGAFRPRPPGLVMRRRFGDCKDKVALLLALWEALGVDARPALVSLSHGLELDSLAPDPVLFDHVIARVQLGGVTHWIDPTRQGQRGRTLAQHAAALNGWALVLDAGTSELERMKVPPEAGVDMRIEKRIAAARYDAPAQMTITTTTGGASAIQARLRLRSQSLESQTEDYRRYYDRFYPGIRTLAPVTVEDDADSNRIRITESYEIPDFWVADSVTGRYFANVGAMELADFQPPDLESDRDAPLALPTPGLARCDTWFEIPEDWNGDPTSRNVRTAYFRWSVEESAEGRVLHIRYEAESYAWWVPAASVEAFAVEMQSAADVYEYSAQSSIGRAGRPQGAGLHWPVLAVLGVGAVAGTWLVVRGARRDAPAWWTERVERFRSEPPAPAVVATAAPAGDVVDAVERDPGLDPGGTTGLEVPAAVAPPEPRRIGGWLILVGLGVLFTPILVVIQFAPLLGLLERTTWAAAIEQTGGRRVLMELTLVFEMFTNVVLFALSLLTAISFVRRRRSFPFHYILTATASLVFITTDLALAAAIGTPSMAINADDVRGLMSAIVSLAIWGTYVLRSQRVHETFVR